MLPSLRARLIGIVGIIAGILSIYLSEWGVIGPPDYIWKVLAAFSVLCLFAVRLTPGTDGKYIGSVSAESVGATRRLIVIRRVSIGILLIAVTIAIFVAPVIGELQSRRWALILALFIFVVSVSLMLYVEIRYRGITEGISGRIL
jgi:hypothetical protein